jgi:hypothetical protein
MSKGAWMAAAAQSCGPGAAALSLVLSLAVRVSAPVGPLQPRSRSAAKVPLRDITDRWTSRPSNGTDRSAQTPPTRAQMLAAEL